MSGNVKDELLQVVAFDLSGRYSAERQAQALAIVTGIIEHLAERGMVVLGPDGEPVRVVELLSTIRSCFDEVAEHVDLSDDAYLIGLVAGLGEAIAEVEG